MEYMTVKQAAKKWNISQRRVQALCADGRIEDVRQLGRMWIIPKNADKPKRINEKK